MGTLQYMAPEQLEGREVDARTDIFAFGVVVYEMATGKKAFEGKSQASLIVEDTGDDPPPISSLQPMTPPALDRVVKSCLAKDPDERWQSAADLARELKWIAERRAGGKQRRRKRPPRSVGSANRTLMYLGWAAAAILLVAFASILFRKRTGEAPSTASVMRTSIVLPAGQRLTSDGGDYPMAVSPDGNRYRLCGRRGSGHATPCSRVK